MPLISPPHDPPAPDASRMDITIPRKRRREFDCPSPTEFSTWCDDAIATLTNVKQFGMHLREQRAREAELLSCIDNLTTERNAALVDSVNLKEEVQRLSTQLSDLQTLYTATMAIKDAYEGKIQTLTAQHASALRQVDELQCEADTYALEREEAQQLIHQLRANQQSSTEQLASTQEELGQVKENVVQLEQLLQQASIASTSGTHITSTLLADTRAIIANEYKVIYEDLPDILDAVTTCLTPAAAVQMLLSLTKTSLATWLIHTDTDLSESALQIIQRAASPSMQSMLLFLNATGTIRLATSAPSATFTFHPVLHILEAWMAIMDNAGQLSETTLDQIEISADLCQITPTLLTPAEAHAQISHLHQLYPRIKDITAKLSRIQKFSPHVDYDAQGLITLWKRAEQALAESHQRFIFTDAHVQWPAAEPAPIETTTLDASDHDDPSSSSNPHAKRDPPPKPQRSSQPRPPHLSTRRATSAPRPSATNRTPKAMNLPVQQPLESSPPQLPTHCIDASLQPSHIPMMPPPSWSTLLHDPHLHIPSTSSANTHAHFLRPLVQQATAFVTEFTSQFPHLSDRGGYTMLPQNLQSSENFPLDPQPLWRQSWLAHPEYRDRYLQAPRAKRINPTFMPCQRRYPWTSMRSKHDINWPFILSATGTRDLATSDWHHNDTFTALRNFIIRYKEVPDHTVKLTVIFCRLLIYLILTPCTLDHQWPRLGFNPNMRLPETIILRLFLRCRDYSSIHLRTLEEMIHLRFLRLWDPKLLSPFTPYVDPPTARYSYIKQHLHLLR